MAFRPIIRRKVLIELPLASRFETAVKSGFPVMLTGPRGTGKTSMVKRAAQRTGKELILVPGHADLMVDELRGNMGLKTGDSTFFQGLVTLAVRKACWLLFDEVNFCRPAVPAWLNNILDEGGILTIPETGEQIEVPKGFLAFFCFNEGYSGTRPINEGLKDRCWVIYCDYWQEDLELKYLTERLDVASIDAIRVIRAANAIRKARREGSLDFDFSIRTLEQWLIDAYERTADLIESFRDVVLPKLGDPLLNGPQHKAMVELAQMAIAQVKAAK